MKSANVGLKQQITEFKEALCEQLFQNKNISTITSQLVQFMDDTLHLLFQRHGLHHENNICLIALGSYGRRELQLHSDIDLLLLHKQNISKSLLQSAQAFIQDCWDLGLEISHQITTVDACADLAANDLSVISSILDAHLLCGRSNLLEELLYQTHPLHMWSSHDFFFAKRDEQLKRYEKYDETAYNLEPNVKKGPGGLRDLQILLAIGKRHFSIKKLAEGVNYGFITSKEYEELVACQHYLWQVRFALHSIAKKPEERLLFDYQVKLANLFGFKDCSQSLAIEQFMKAYFKVIKRSRELNDLILQWFDEAIVYHQKQQIRPLNEFFQLANNYIEVKNARLFAQKPQTLLEIFLWIAKFPEIDGVRANTIRLIRQHLYLIGNRFRHSKSATETFLAIFETEDPYDALHHMNRYGVLGHYLACFAAVTGQMQYDLFHIYTVDQHTLFVIRNLCRFAKPKYNKPFALAAQLIGKIKNTRILYLAALFHDIAKGRGGDHSELGAQEAEEFALRHGLNHEESKLLIWLVRHHLLMSRTAQRQDIYDPKTIQHFCSFLPQADYLEYLYLLTVADICATNHTLWNSWKDSLLIELYQTARQFLQEKTLDEEALIKDRQGQALKILKQLKLDESAILQLWDTFRKRYFLHQPAEIIAQHTQAILQCKKYPLVLIGPHHNQGGTEVFIYMPHRDERFIISTTVLSNYHTTIQEAAILTSNNNYDLDSYVILDEQHKPFLSQQRSKELQKALEQQLAETKIVPTITKRRISRIQAHFRLKPQISFSEENKLSQLFLITPDRPGLLANISRVFLTQQIHLHHAKIATAGERAEDMFFISTKEGRALNKEERELLKEALIEELTKL